MDRLKFMIKVVFNYIKNVLRNIFFISKKVKHTIRKSGGPGSRLGPLYIVSYCINWVETSWTYSKFQPDQDQDPSKVNCLNQNPDSINSQQSCNFLFLGPDQADRVYCG